MTSSTRREQAASSKSKFFTDLLLLAVGYLPLMAAAAFVVQMLTGWNWLVAAAVGIGIGIPTGGFVTHKLQQMMEAPSK